MKSSAPPPCRLACRGGALCLALLVVGVWCTPRPCQFLAADSDAEAWQAYRERSEHLAKLDRESLAKELASLGLKKAVPAADGTTLGVAGDKHRAWLASEEAVRIAHNVVSFQAPCGGWSKNIDMTLRPRKPGESYSTSADGRWVGTFDNGATHRQLRFLAAVHDASGDPSSREAFVRGIEYVLAAQYPGGGWPQVYPLQGGYHDHITFNDGAMVEVLRLLRDVAGAKPPFAFADEGLRARASRAVEKGIDCILRCQVVVDGVKTVWCAQHDAITLAPAPARSYEKASLSGGESVGIVRFLLEIDAPSPSVRESIGAAVAWLDAARIRGIRIVRAADPAAPGGYDKKVVSDPTAPPVWARFYEIGSSRPIFCGRDGVVKYALSEIEVERRTGYAWYVTDAEDLLSRRYPEWVRRWGGAAAK